MGACQSNLVDRRHLALRHQRAQRHAEWGDARGFTVAFPAEPKVEPTSCQASSGRSVEARVYSVVQESGEFKVTVADLSHTEMSEGNVMAYAVLMLSRGGDVKIDIPSTRRIIGRQASIDGVDGRQTYASVFTFSFTIGSFIRPLS